MVTTMGRWVDMWGSGAGGDEVESVVGNPDIVRACPLVGAGLIHQHARRESQVHVIGFNQVQKGLDQVGWRVELVVGFRFSKEMVAVEVPEPDHRICGGRKDKGEVGG